MTGFLLFVFGYAMVIALLMIVCFYIAEQDRNKDNTSTDGKEPPDYFNQQGHGE